MARLGRSFPVQVRNVAAVQAATANANPTPAVVTATAQVLAVASAGGGATVTATVVTAAASVLSPTVTRTATASPTVVTATASVVAPSSAGPVYNFPVPVGVSNHKFVDQNDDPIMLPIFSSWAMAMRLSTADITWAIDSLADRGFRGVTFGFCGGVAAGSEDFAAVQYEDRDGNDFFTGTPFQSSLGAAFAKTDWIVQECARREMIAVFALFCSFGDSGVIEELEAATNAQMRTFGQNVGARYDGYPNIVWQIMGDTSWGASDALGRRIDYYARGLDEGRTSHPNLWIMEPFLGGDSMAWTDEEGTDPTGYEWWHLDANGMYSYDNDGVVKAEAAYAEAVGFVGTRDIAVWDSEGPYAHNTQYDDGYGQRTGIRMRNASDFIEGFSMVNHGSEPWWTFDFSGSGATAYLDVPDEDESVDAQHVWSIVAQYIDGDATYTPTSWIVTGEGTTDAKAAAGYSDTAALAMFPTSRTIAVNTTVIAGTGNVRLRWFDPSAGTYTTIAGSEAQNASRSVTHPGNNSAGATDWLLVVDTNVATDANPTPSVVTATAGVLSPTVSVGRNITATVVTATAGVLSPSISVGRNITATVVTATASVPSPSVSAGGNASVSATVVTATAAPVTPTVAVGVTITAVVVTAAATVVAPTASANVAISATAITATASVPSPSISAGGSASVSATVVTATASVPTPALAAGSTVTAAVVTAAAQVLTAIVTVGLLATDTYKSRHYREHSRSRHYRGNGSTQSD